MWEVIYQCLFLCEASSFFFFFKAEQFSYIGFIEIAVNSQLGGLCLHVWVGGLKLLTDHWGDIVSFDSKVEYKKNLELIIMPCHINTEAVKTKINSHSPLAHWEKLAVGNDCMSIYIEDTDWWQG